MPSKEKEPPKPIYMADPYSSKNMTAFMPTPIFTKMVQFASTRADVKTMIKAEYLTECGEVEDAEQIYKWSGIIYASVFVTLIIYSSAKYRHGVETVAEEVHFSM